MQQHNLIDIDRRTRLSIFRRMLEMRRFEETVLEYFSSGESLGNIHVYIGQEGTGAAVLEAARPEDLMLTHHRNHGHVIGKGADPARALAELLGRSTGLLGGRGGGLHLSDPKIGILQTSAIVGGSISLSTGAAFGIKRSGGGRVAIGFFGDSALEEGVAYEALNLAALWKLPVIYVCENNSVGAQGLAGGGYPTLIHASGRLSSIPEALGITTRVIADGSDAAQVFSAASEARRLCIEGKGPVFLETLTVRWPGSQTILPKSIGRTEMRACLGEVPIEGEHQDWVKHSDPILRWVRDFVSGGFGTREDIFSCDQEVTARIVAAAKFASDSTQPDSAGAFDKVFA